MGGGDFHKCVLNDGELEGISNAAHLRPRVRPRIQDQLGLDHTPESELRLDRRTAAARGGVQRGQRVQTFPRTPPFLLLTSQGVQGVQRRPVFFV